MAFASSAHAVPDAGAIRVAATPEPPLVMETTIPVPGISSQRLEPLQIFSFGGAAVDGKRSLYVLADRTNRSIDVFDTRKNTLLRQIFAGPCRDCRFTGVDPTMSLARSGPDGVVMLPGTSRAWVGDVGSIKLVDYVAGSIVRSITIPAGRMPSIYRSNLGCYDAHDHLLMFSNPDDPTPFASWIDTASGRIVAQVAFPATLGLRDCLYRADTKRFYVENAGTPQNQTGEIDIFAAASIRLGRTDRTATYASPDCAPRGLAQNARGATLVGCDLVSTVIPEYDLGTHRLPLQTKILDLRTGRTIKRIPDVGGADTAAFDPLANRWYVAAWRMTANALPDGPPTPVLGIVDARRFMWIANVPVAGSARSVSVDPRTGHVFVPVEQSAALGGGITVFSVPRR